MAPQAVRDFPTAGNYQEALQNPKVCFTDPDLANSVPELTKLRQPRAISGAFASVFPFTRTDTGDRYAIKCFTRHIPDQQSRYRAISDKLSGLSITELSQPWKIGFEYLPDAVLVGTTRYPVLKMEWAQGITLSAWLDAHHTDHLEVGRLADRFAQLITDLERHGIAHGDLQHGNLLVADDGTLRLLDYDGMFVPALSGFGGTERGHRNYQSPNRGDQDFGTTMDRFSSWVIYFALKAVAIDPDLWLQLHEPHGEYLLLTEQDFKNPAASPRFPALLSHADNAIQGLADHLRVLAYQPLAALPSLAAGARPVAPAPAAPAAAPVGNGVHPAWMTTGHLSPGSIATPGTTRQQNSGNSAFTDRRPVDVLAAVLIVIAVLMSVLSSIVGAPIAALGPIIVAWVATRAAKRSRAESISLRGRLHDLTAQRAGIADTASAAAALHHEAAEFDRFEQQRVANETAARAQSTQQYHRCLADVERQRLARTAEFERRISALPQQLQSALDAALTSERHEYVVRELARFSLSQASITGIGKALTAELAANGIRTAADFTGYQLVSNSSGYNSSTARITLGRGGTLHVKGIGQAKAQALTDWRRGRLQRVEAQCTIRTPTQGPAIRSRIDAQKQQLQADLRKVDSEIGALKAQAAQQLETEQNRVTAAATAATAAAVRKREDLSRRRLKLQGTPHELALIDNHIAQIHQHRRELNYSKYIRFALTGR
ncbi:AarF/UbiB family protein [Nocardia sp. NPDC058058]|uniref:AarF/UbiB family protein n=1 Tax=Nocardia sp. NPDC058058 TaxID=3346317 RepID=UPI0036D92514